MKMTVFLQFFSKQSKYNDLDVNFCRLQADFIEIGRKTVALFSLG